MNNPFSSIKTDDKDRKRQQLEKQIKDKAFDITKKIVTRRCESSDVDDLQNLYNEYFKKYPDKKREMNGRKRISQLRQLL
jgi:hypothetical protein